MTCKGHLRFFICFAVHVTYCSLSLEEYCNWDTFEATCGTGSVIMITNARYGRMKTGRCITEDHLIGCQEDILPYVESVCSGHNQCSIRPSAMVHENITPCPRNVMSYLEVAYKCIQVSTLSGNSCTGQPITLLEQSGYISSYTANLLNVGMENCPLRIKSDRAEVFCDNLAIISEPLTLHETTLCAGPQRVKHAYLSETSTIDVVISPNIKNSHFLLKYEVVGCPEVIAPPYSQVNIDGDIAVVTCDAVDASWELRCVDNVWTGGEHAVECLPAENQDVLKTLIGEGTTSIKGVLIVVCLGFGIGFIFGVVLLLLLLICMKRHNKTLPCGLTPDDGRKNEMPSVDDLDYNFRYCGEADKSPFTNTLPPYHCHTMTPSRTSSVNRHPGYTGHGTLPSRTMLIRNNTLGYDRCVPPNNTHDYDVPYSENSGEL